MLGCVGNILPRHGSSESELRLAFFAGPALKGLVSANQDGNYAQHIIMPAEAQAVRVPSPTLPAFLLSLCIAGIWFACA